VRLLVDSPNRDVSASMLNLCVWVSWGERLTASLGRTRRQIKNVTNSGVASNSK